MKKKGFILILGLSMNACSLSSSDRAKILPFTAVSESFSCPQARCAQSAFQSDREAGADQENAFSESSENSTCDIKARPFGGGNGTLSRPFQICSVDQWNRIADFSERHFVLKTDLV
jgi:hypothetical protein